jgi:large subunit GTPase 1
VIIHSARRQWADYFDEQGVKYAFYSAADAAALQQAQRDAAEALNRAEAEQVSDESESDEADDDDKNETDLDSADNRSEDDTDGDDIYFSAEEEEEDVQDTRARILSVQELEEMFIAMSPDLCGGFLSSRTFQIAHSIPEFSDSIGQAPSKLVVGLVGYPNVGKSSTINSLLGEKKVSVSSTPGKTKHFQTIHLSDSIVLCDCPGLVFPQFATTKADLVCDGVLPIDQLKEYTGPISLITKRLPKEILETTYGLTIKIRGVEEGGDGSVTAENFLVAYASKSIYFQLFSV